MTADRGEAVVEASIAARAAEIRDAYLLAVRRRTDRRLAALLIVEWLVAVVAAILIAPYAWEGSSGRIHPHVWLAVGLGGLLAVYPAALARGAPGLTWTRHAIALGQMMMAALFIHLGAGRIETHFMVFGSLAFLSFYRDPAVLLTASAAVAVDHWLRGVFFPQSVFGVLAASPWRWVEHTAWVAFEDWFLWLSIRQSGDEVRVLAEREARLEATNREIERAIAVRTEELRLARDHAENASRAKSDFVATVSHELRTPAGGIVAMAELLLDEPRPPEERERVEVLMDSARSLVTLVSDLLDLSRAESGKLEIEAVPFDIGRVVGDTVGMLQPAARKKGVDLVVEPGGAVERWVLGDPLRVRQVLTNLAANAIKFTPRGSVRVAVSEVAHVGAERTIEIAVADSGIGMSQAEIERVFDRFVQANAATRHRFGGSGLGLTISRRIAEAMGGTISVESAPERGSTFRVRLPMAMASASDAGLA